MITREIANPQASCNITPFLSDRLDVDRNILANFPSKNTSKHNVP